MDAGSRADDTDHRCVADSRGKPDGIRPRVVHAHKIPRLDRFDHEERLGKVECNTILVLSTDPKVAVFLQLGKLLSKPKEGVSEPLSLIQAAKISILIDEHDQVLFGADCHISKRTGLETYGTPERM